MGYKDPEWLAEKYQEHTQEEIAEMCGVSRTTITRWMQKHSLETRDGWQQADGQYKDPEWLRQKYVDERCSLKDIGDEFGVSKETIKYWIKKHNIPLRTKTEGIQASWEGAEQRRDDVGERFAKIHRVNRPFFFTHKSGYERVGASNGKGGSDFVPVHRLIAVAEYGIDAVKDKVVHHKSNIPWDNRPGNLEIMTAEEHSRMHRLEQENPRVQE